MEGMREWYERALGDVNNLTRDLRESTKEMERINIREREAYSDMEGLILNLLEV